MLSRLSTLRQSSSNAHYSLSSTHKHQHSHPQQTQSRSYYRFQVHTDFVKRWTTNNTLQQWINDRIQLFQPCAVHLCDGSEDENLKLIEKQIQMGTLVKLNEQLRPNSYLARSSKSDTARVEDATFICSESKLSAGPTK